MTNPNPLLTRRFRHPRLWLALVAAPLSAQALHDPGTEEYWGVPAANFWECCATSRYHFDDTCPDIPMLRMPPPPGAGTPTLRAPLQIAPDCITPTAADCTTPRHRVPPAHPLPPPRAAPVQRPAPPSATPDPRPATPAPRSSNFTPPWGPGDKDWVPPEERWPVVPPPTPSNP